ncbi:DUF4291 family protein [Nonomuraea jabiensis]|uniref:DUF4291 family protein n=1 Tax=Nonomuraea jabiensis TaxID=882448 RepID=UPI00341384CA
MAPQYQIRADYDADTIVVYQAYAPAIADAALRAGRFVAPFSFHRMTWIKPSFLWLMHRSNWTRKPGQERVLAVRMTRQGWEEALSQAVLTTADPAAGSQGRGIGTDRARRQGPAAVPRRAGVSAATDAGKPPFPG